MAPRLRDRFIRALSEFVDPAEPPPLSERPKGGLFRSLRRDDYDTDRYARTALTPSKVGRILRDADGGDTARQYELFEKVEQDPRVSRLYLRRRQAVLSNPLRIDPADETDARAVQAAELCKAAVFGGEYNGTTYPGISNLDEGLFDLSDAIGKAFAVNYVRWDVQGGLVLPVEFDRWPQSQFQLGDPAANMAQDHDDIRVTTDDAWNGKRIAEFAQGTWIVHVQKTFSQPIARAAMFRAVVWYYLFKTFGMGDWSILLERYGVPARLGKYPQHADDKERSELWSAVKALGKDHAAIAPVESTIELIEQKGQGSGGAPHPALIKHCNEEIAVAIAGNTMAVDQGDRGARSAKEAFQAEDLVQTRFDANGRGQGTGGGLAGTLQRDLLAPLVGYNMGEDAPVPLCYFDLDDLEDLGARIKIDKQAQEMGWPVTAGYMANKYFNGELPAGVDADEVLESGAAATAAALGEGGIDAMLTLAAAKKKSMSRAIRTLRSFEE